MICTDVSLSGETSAACRQGGRISRSFTGYYLTAHRRPVRLKVQHCSLGRRFPHSALTDNVTGQDSDELRWRAETGWLLQKTTDKRDKNTHTAGAICFAYTRLRVSNHLWYGFVCDRESQCQTNKLTLKYTTKLQIINHVTFWFNSTVWPVSEEIIITLKEL